jgi:hypothetical protein
MQKYIGIILLLFFGAGVHAQNNIKSWEYWFNSDYASVVNEDVAGIHTLEVNEMIDVSTLGDGLHTLSFRFKDARGVWGPPQTRFFIKYPWTGASATQLISEYEYRVDNSNGDAVGGDETTGYTHVALETPVSPAEIALTIDLREHPKGEYYIHFRAKDTRGLWGSLVTKSMTKEAFPVAAFSPSTATHCVNSAVQFVNESIDADTWLWDFGDGTTSTDFEPEHVFSGAGDFEVSLTATDSESGRENTITQTLTINPTYSSQLPSAENVIAYYPFNGNANDESGNEHHGAVNGATLAPDRFGKSDGAYVFDGVDDYIDLGDWENGGAMSFAFWARWDAFNWYSRIIDLGNGSSSDNIVICNHQDNNNLFFSIFLGSSDTKFSASGITLNQWDFYTATVDGSGVMTLYKNGIQIGQYNGVTPNYMLRTKQYIGKSNFTSNDDEYFEGAIDEITIYDIALAPEEVQEVFEKSQNSIPPVNMEICESETPFIFGGQELSESGTYTEAFQTVHGCDSVVTVNLQVNPVYDVMYSGDDAIPDYLVNETFEEIPLNTFPDDWVIRYAGTGADDHFVVDDPVKNGVHALKVSGSGWAANLSKPVENIPDNVVLEGWMRAEDVASSDRNGLGIGNPDVGSWGAYWGRVEFYNGNLITFNYTGNAGGYGTQYVLQPASPNTWYHVKIEADAAAGTYKVYIDGQQASSATGGSTTTEFPLLTSISATSAELYGNGMIYFDDIRMYEGGAHPVVICESETPYIFGDQELTESGTYTETFQTIHGCDSVVTLNLVVNPTYNHTDAQTICEGETYVFGTQNLTTPGEYTEVFESVDGCDSTVVLTLTVNPGYNHTDEQTICEGETYVFGTQNLTTSGEYTEVFESVDGCDSTVVLTLTVNPGYNHTDEQTICEGETYVFGTQNLTTPGEYTEVFESVDGCDSTVVLTLTVNPGYNHTDEQTICEGKTYVFGTQNLTTPGEYTEVFESVNGCDSTVVLTLTVNPGYNHTETATICEGETYVFGTQNLTTSGEYTEVFESVDGCDSTVVLTLTLNPGYNHTETATICEGETYVFGTQNLTTSGEYTEVFKSVNGCDSTVVLTLTVNPGYNHTDEQTICEGETYVFGTQNLTTSGEYTEVFESVDGCDSTVVLTLTVNPDYNHTDEQTICEGETYVFGTQNLTTPGEYTEVFESVDGCDSTVVLTLTVNPGYNHTDEQTICEGKTYVFGTQNLTTSGEYTEVFESVNGCDSTVVLTLTVNPWYNHTETATICEGETYVFGTQNLTTSGEYTEVFESVDGCDSTVVLTLTVNPGYNHTETATICEGETYVFGTQNLTTSGEYTEVFESVDGCDSTVVLTLTVNPGYNHTETATICEGETYVFGTQNLTTSGEYTEVFESVNGCDSVVTLTLTVNPMYEETVEVTIHEDELPYIFGGENLNEGGVYTKTFTSVAGCDSIVTLTLKVLEYSVPVAVCNPITIYLNETGNYSLSSVDLKNIAAGSSDAHTAFADLILSVTPDAFTCADAGNDVDVMVIVTNEDNYSDTCYTSVSVEDNIAPKVDCHDLEVYLGEKGEAFIDVNKIYSDAYDACGIKNIKTSREVFTCDDLGYNYFSVSVTDFNQNKTSCLNILAVFDTIRPVFGTVDDIEVAAPEGECKTTIDYPEIPAGDNCGVENLFLYEGLGPDGEFPVGTTTERWVAVDASGNSDTLTFEVKISDTPSAPGLDAIPDVEVEEDADWVTVTVTGISDGSECEEYPLGFIFSAENDQLIESYLTEYVTGEEMAYLKLLPSPDATGESNATLTVTNSETGQETGIDFILRITPVNDPPYLVHPVQDLEMKAGDSLEVVFNPEKGIIFDDVDEDDILQLSVRPEDGTTLPEWLVFRNDSLLAFPAAADTGCVELLLVATDLTGEEVNSPFMLCVDFSVGTNLFAEQGIKIYPNPTTGKVYIELSGLADRRADVSVVNILGQKVLHKIYQSEGHWEIDLSNQVSGIYLLKIRGNGIGFNRKIVLNREE